MTGSCHHEFAILVVVEPALDLADTIAGAGRHVRNSTAKCDLCGHVLVVEIGQYLALRKSQDPANQTHRDSSISELIEEGGSDGTEPTGPDVYTSSVQPYHGQYIGLPDGELPELLKFRVTFELNSRERRVWTGWAAVGPIPAQLLDEQICTAPPE